MEYIKGNKMSRSKLIILIIFGMPLMLLAYPVAKLIPKYREQCPDTFIEYIIQIRDAIKDDWRNT